MATEKEANKQETAAAAAPAEETKGTGKKPGTGKKAEGEEAGTDVDAVVYHEPVVRQKAKSNWDLKKCQKVAKRFDTVEAWQSGAPSCYKSAIAHNWIAQCTSHMKAAKFVKKIAQLISLCGVVEKSRSTDIGMPELSVFMKFYS